ncbi:hypothetical protein [Pseudomonas sp. RA_35y_Pfl2_P32]|uniref:hypothetical protein n=1 Tax=Pseudomonas sp. RA_35y_Pfl2_P32 TaxID=3088705 RepID=UPI0030DAD5D4
MSDLTKLESRRYLPGRFIKATFFCAVGLLGLLNGTPALADPTTCTYEQGDNPARDAEAEPCLQQTRALEAQRSVDDREIPLKAGQLAIIEAGAEHRVNLSAVLSPLPGLPGYTDEPYTLFADGVEIQEDLAGRRWRDSVRARSRHSGLYGRTGERS